MRRRMMPGEELPEQNPVSGNTSRYVRPADGQRWQEPAQEQRDFYAETAVQGDMEPPEDDLQDYADDLYAEEPYYYTESEDDPLMDYEEEIPLTEEEEREQREIHWRTLAQLKDFAVVIIGTILIVVMVAMLFYIVHWTMDDLKDSFSLFRNSI